MANTVEAFVALSHSHSHSIPRSNRRLTVRLNKHSIRFSVNLSAFSLSPQTFLSLMWGTYKKSLKEFVWRTTYAKKESEKK